MNPEVARLRRQSAHRKYTSRLRYVRVLWGIAAVLLVLLLIEVLVAFCFSPRFWVYRIDVHGGDTLTAPEVIRLVNLRECSNYYRLSPGTLARRVAENEPRARAVEVSRGAVGTLAVQVTERSALCRLGDAVPPCYVDSEGVLFTRPVAPSPPVPVVEGPSVTVARPKFGTRVRSARVRTVVECLTIMKKVFAEGGEAGSGPPLEVTRVLLGTTGRMTLILRQGTRILLGAPEHFEEKLWVVRNTIVYASSQGYALDKLEYIDARVFSRPAGLGAEFKPRNEEAHAP